MNGLFLQGGGAKGAFQAGVIYGLYERGYDFNVISATSIGAINAYFVYSNNYNKLEDMWTNPRFNDFDNNSDIDMVVDNQKVIDMLHQFEGKNNKIEAVYVNYVEIIDSQLKEKRVDITKLDREDSLKVIKYSSLLPGRLEKGQTVKQFIETFDSQIVFEKFKQDLVKGLYDGYKLDGGIVNNSFLNPFIENKVDKIYAIVFYNDYRLPEYILKEYNRDDIIIISPKTKLIQSDTLRFEKEFCSKLFKEGYEISKEVNL